LASFLVILGSGEQKLVSSQKKALHIGRLPESEIYVDEPVVSRRHAEIFRSDAAYFVKDTGSRNGTLVNGDRISQPTRLAPGDVVGVGNSRIIFEPSESVSFLKDRGAAEPTSAISLSTPAPPKQTMAPTALLETVADIAREIVQDKPIEAVLDTILEMCVDKTGAERAAIMLLDEDGNLSPQAYLSKARLHSKFAISSSIARKAIEENQAILIKDVAGDDNIQMSESIASLKIRSAICTPLWNGERTVGVMYVDTTKPDRQFGEIDLLFFSSLSGMIAEKIQNAMLADIAREKRRLDAELEIATEIQNRLFPAEIPRVEGFDLSAFNRSCTEVGGDYFDIIPADGRIGIAIADVAGKGIGAAMLMSNLQAMLQVRSVETPDPGELLKRMNLDLIKRVGEGRFITLFYLTLDPETGRMRYSNAGHNPPYRLDKNGDISALEVSGMPLGILPDINYENSETELGPGEVLLLYSDGISECMNKAGDLFGEERLKQVLSESAGGDAHSIRGAIFSAVDTFRENEPYSDDMTLIVLKRVDLTSEAPSS
jgi:serine phosphatase RsbU (regulator of sigma subunit)/pSer/pThr/pTyr-binding forkhead associated (FHA) protein